MVTRCILGQKYEDSGGRSRVEELARRMMVQLIAFGFGDFFPSLKWIDRVCGFIGSLKSTSRELDAFYNQVIEEHRARMESDDKISNPIDFVDILLHLQKNPSSIDFELTNDRIKAILQDLLVGGIDTTLIAIELLVAELLRNPRVMTKVQEEIRRFVGEKAIVDVEDISRMDYFKCFVKENLRLHLPVPLVGPRETSESVEIGCYHVPAKARVLVNALPEDLDMSEVFGLTISKKIPIRAIPKKKSDSSSVIPWIPGPRDETPISSLLCASVALFVPLSWSQRVGFWQGGGVRLTGFRSSTLGEECFRVVLQLLSRRGGVTSALVPGLLTLRFPTSSDLGPLVFSVVQIGCLSKALQHSSQTSELRAKGLGVRVGSCSVKSGYPEEVVNSRNGISTMFLPHVLSVNGAIGHSRKLRIQLRRMRARCHMSWVWITCVGPLAHKLGGPQVGYNKPYLPRTCRGIGEGHVGKLCSLLFGLRS
ncbi:hypothetical protein TIFTF001_026797 [Ficus carica]|uniref:Cytochrome P450 n=1 Tax=Ficus carica TaxID=3494 RepID=A0AA88IYN2_FICCA|nr:hypothetical protein TIFTF001_026797 [Ficus carica]